MNAGRARIALTLVVSFAGGVLLTAGIGGALGAFDRGPTEQDVAAARQRGIDEGEFEVNARMAEREDEQRLDGYQSGREAAEWLLLDRLPNPDSWFAGVMAGRREAEAREATAWQAGLADGQRQGIDEALGVVRSGSDGPHAGLDERLD